jgi:hypothetical protein
MIGVAVHSVGGVLNFVSAAAATTFAERVVLLGRQIVVAMKAAFLS